MIDKMKEQVVTFIGHIYIVQQSHLFSELTYNPLQPLVRLIWGICGSPGRHGSNKVNMLHGIQINRG